MAFQHLLITGFDPFGGESINPFLPQQAKNGQPSMELAQMVRGLTAAIEVLSS